MAARLRPTVDAGASLYVSHGAPRQDGIERPIFYDLANLVFQTTIEEGFYDGAVWQSVVAECRLPAGISRT
jgi:poly-gamma-glutamate capsule biosynthesis protein CapA/YwtB (metallophosphatase superfamily)